MFPLYTFRVRCLTDGLNGNLPFRPSGVIATARLQRTENDHEMPLEVVGWGAHRDQKIARMIAQAEASERLALNSIPLSALSFGSLQESTQRVDPRTLQELSPARARASYLEPFRPQEAYYWMNAVEVFSGRPVQIIADLCCAYEPDSYPQRFAWVNTSGMAAHRDEGAAMKAALFELFERDALMVTWMARYAPPRISVGRLPVVARACVKTATSLNYTCVSLDITCRGVPVVMAVAYRQKLPALIVALAARASLKEAACSAWKELEVELFLRLQQQHLGVTRVVPVQEVTSVSDHADFYAQPENLHHAAFLWRGRRETKRDLGEIVSLAQLAHRLDTLYKVDYGNVHGFQVVRLLSPSLVPLFFGYNQFPLRHPARRTADLCGYFGPAWSRKPIPPHPLA